MRLLVVTPYGFPEGGGLERYAHEVLVRLGRRGHEVEAIAFRATGTRNGGRALEAPYRMTRVDPLLRLGNTPVHPRFGRIVSARMRARRPDVVVVHTPVPFPAEAAARAARAAGVPYVVTYHAGRLRGSTAFLDALAALDRATTERSMLEHAAGLVAVAPFVREHALARHRPRVRVVPPGVDTDRFAPEGPPEPGRLLFVGPLSGAYRWKGIDTLFKAFASVRREVPEARLTVVGDGERAAELAETARRLGGASSLLDASPRPGSWTNTSARRSP